MFFTGDTSTRKRVDLGGRSSKERDRQKLLEQTRLERNKRLWFRQQNSAAVTIQKCFRGRKAAELERSKAREKFFYTYRKVDRNCFHPNSEYLPLLFFFLNPRNPNDFSALVETCRAFLHCVKDSGNVMSVFLSKECAHDSCPVDHRVKRLAYNCVQSLHENRHSLKNQLLLTSEQASLPAIVFLETIAILIDPKQPGACKVAGYLHRRNVFTLFREVLFTAKENAKTSVSTGSVSSLEHAIALLITHVGQRRCTCSVSDLQWSFSSQILTIPILWQFFPHLKEVFTSHELSKYYIHQVVSSVNHEYVLDNDMASEFPAYACLLGNVLESASVILALPNCTYDLGKEVTIAVTLLLEAFPPANFSNQRNEEIEGESKLDNKALPKVLHGDIEKQIYSAMDPRFFIQLMNILFRGSGLVDGSPKAAPSDEEVAAVGSVCTLLHAIFNTLSLERIMTALAYRTELVTVLWNFMKRCHENKQWPFFDQMLHHLHEDAPGWLLPLAVFCPVYKHILMIVDNEEFYEKEKPLSIADVRDLVAILKQALWHLLWANPVMAPASAHKAQSIELVHHKVSMVVSELLSQLLDWNNRRQFIHPSEFHAESVNESFVSQAAIENTKANDILRRAPFLVPFTSRVRIFTSQLAITRQRNDFHTVFARHRFRIRRDHILEDAYNQLNSLSEEDLRGVIRISFINEFGADEAGIDGGGIFKDFMENITRAAFDVQYGLFKETGDHMLYPNPGSGMIHDQHLQFFRFLGTVLAKAMFEGILVDIPFATFFLSKLKQKYNYLNDLPSLDPELYRHLLFLKHYEGDLTELELYFVIVNNEYGEQMEEELLPGGKNIRVTNENVITFIHLMANHRLNFQIRQQSSYFLRGFQQLIRKDWIQMFNEHELQLLISGSLDGLDIDDLRSNTNYTGGYHSEHYVIEMFWEVLKSFSFENQTKFLKFVTGCSRGPLLGFRFLEPLFCIQRAAGTASDDTLNRLPTSATCMNLLKLPPYRSKEQLERKLLYAISADAGFDLS